VSQASASLLLVVLMLGLAIYFVFAPPPGFDEGIVYRITIPFILVACAFSVLENLRTRTHIGQLVGALRSIMGRSGVPATPEVKAEAIEILLKSLRSDKDSVRETAAAQLKQLTGEDHGSDPGAWEQWWAQAKKNYGR
jgi:hypothetical protein